MKRTIWILMVLLLLVTMAIPGYAAEVSQDGLTVNLAAQQDGDNITAALILTNQSDAPITAVELEPLIPDGYALDGDPEAVELLAPGESRSFTLRYAPPIHPRNRRYFPCRVHSFGRFCGGAAVIRRQADG